MKTYSIGRDLNCDIVINDSTDVISRRHALLNVTSTGRMTIVDQSSNGTYVNGIRISPNVPVPVTRKDIVSLAHVAKLNWNQVPQANQWVKYAVISCVAVAIIIAIVIGLRQLKTNPDSPIEIPHVPIEEIDSAKKKEEVTPDTTKKAEKQDTVKSPTMTERQDTVKTPRNPSKPKTGSGKKSKSKTDDKREQEKEKNSKPRAIV